MLAICTSGQDHATPPPHMFPAPSTVSPTASPSSTHGEQVAGETVTEAMVLPEGEVVAQAANASGNKELQIRDGIETGEISFLVNCQGKGTLTVSVESVGLRFPLECMDAEVSSVLNQLDLKSSCEHATVKATASSQVHWALTVGR